MKQLIFLILLLVGSSSAMAVGLDVGYFYCEDCLMTGPVPDGDTYAFIRSTVNSYTNGSWVDSNGNAKHVEICNNSICVTWQYVKAGTYTNIQTTPNTGSHNYKNSGGGGGAGGPPSGGGGDGGILEPGSGMCIKTVVTYPDGSTNTSYDCSGA